ncbi:unnamed protein product [Choristocarpus tenellus]
MHPSKATDLDKSAEYVKAELERVQAEYEVNRKAKVKVLTQLLYWHTTCHPAHGSQTKMASRE